MSTEVPPSAPGQFPPPLWTQILRAGGDTSTDASAALERMARAYWPPLNS